MTMTRAAPRNIAQCAARMPTGPAACARSQTSITASTRPEMRAATPHPSGTANGQPVRWQTSSTWSNPACTTELRTPLQMLSTKAVTGWRVGVCTELCSDRNMRDAPDLFQTWTTDTSSVRARQRRHGATTQSARRAHSTLKWRPHRLGSCPPSGNPGPNTLKIIKRAHCSPEWPPCRPGPCRPSH